MDTDEFFGCCGFHGRDSVLHPELGIWIKHSAHGHRYGREAILTIVAWAIEHVEFEYLVYPVSKENISSRKIPESMGGAVFQEIIKTSMDGRELDEVIYKITKEHFNCSTHGK